MINELKFDTLQEGWEGINEYLYLEVEDIEKKGGGSYGPEWVSYNNYIVMKNAWVDPDFNFGKVLGYAKKKWSALVNNYVNFQYLDIIRAEISMRIKKNARSYNYAYHFSNSHGSGKDCLISLTFTKRLGITHPVAVFTIRTSEVTKRLIFDFLLVQRIIEYVYGHNDVEVHMFAPSFYITAESFVMYHNHKDLFKMKVHYGKGEHREAHKFHEKVEKIYHEYSTHPDPRSIRYKVHRRSAMQIQRDEQGNPLSGVKDMFAKDLKLKEDFIEYPEDIITHKQRKAWRRAPSKR